MRGVRLARHYLAGMLKKNWGRILFISSESAVQIPSEMVGELRSLWPGPARRLTVFLPDQPSRKVCGFLEAMAKQQNKSKQVIEKEFFEHVRPSSLLKRFATVDEVAAMATYIAGELSSATNGAALGIDGGVVKAIL
jgi:NAD(P)-dependent dehydrogenase (short-subunit alcohol dehydrogenase family)